MQDARPLITLLTDFGERDCFVASMKGVILSINSTAAVVDLSHQIASHQIQEAGYFLKSCYRYFPAGTIHVAVVDPGVGTERRALLFPQRLIYWDRIMGCSVNWSKSRGGMADRESEYRLEAAGSTFDGRDVFARPLHGWQERAARHFWAVVRIDSSFVAIPVWHEKC